MGEHRSGKHSKHRSRNKSKEKSKESRHKEGRHKDNRRDRKRRHKSSSQSSYDSDSKRKRLSKYTKEDDRNKNIKKQNEQNKISNDDKNNINHHSDENSSEEEARVLDEARKLMISLQTENKKILEDVEEERRKRRERVKVWQEQLKSESDISTNNCCGKIWNLDDEQEEEEEKVENTTNEDIEMCNKEEDDEIDPLEMFMNNINETLNQDIKSTKITPVEDEEEKTRIIETIVPIDPVSNRHDVEILEQFGDAAEYSSEEEIVDEGPLTLPSKKNIKILPTVDHNKIYYKNFRKDIYIEVPEIAKLTEQQVIDLRLELDNIQIKGKGCPRPIKKWVQAGLNPTILNILKSLNYHKPTPIQAQTLPAIMSGRDVIGIAKTGSGKTLAFLLPLLRHVIDQGKLNDGDGPIAVVMTPTRELAMQIWRECRMFTKYLNIKALCIYGGTVVSEQISELKRGAEIVICTPGRMIDMLTVNSGRITNMRRCTFIVLDEADRMFDLGFEPQVMKIIEQIRPDRQTCLFTATFSLHMEAIARKILSKPLEIITGTKNKVCEDVKQYLVVVDHDNKFLKLLELLGMYGEAGNILIFVDKQDSADELLRDLLIKGYPCRTLHGGMDQYDRDSTLTDFKNSLFTLLIATSVASRGIDCKNIVMVINYDCPNHPEDYVHRCGRTGRAGMKGNAITFITNKDAKYIKGILTVVEDTDCEVPQSVINLYKRYLESEGNRGYKSSGFGGHGFKFNDFESIHGSDTRKMIKWSFGWQDSGDEAEAEDRVLRQIEQQIDKSFSNRPRAGMNQTNATVNKDKIEKAQSIANKLDERLKTSSTAVALINNSSEQKQYEKIVKQIKPLSSSDKSVDNNNVVHNDKNMDMVKEIASKLNMKFNPEISNSSKPTNTTVKKLGTGEVFFEEIDINDFPLPARQRITSKECLDYIAHTSDCALTVRGTYCQPGKPVDFTERRLHLLIEGNTEFKVQICKAEIKRVLKEECVKSDYIFTQTSSRYRIV